MNGVKMNNYIDDLYRKMMASQGRMPANAAFDQVLATGKAAPQGTNFVGQTDEEILANPIAPDYVLPKNAPVAGLGQRPIELPPGYKVQVPQSEIIRQNRNNAIESLQDEAANIRGNIGTTREQFGSEKEALSGALARMMSLGDETYKSPEIDAVIQAQTKRMENAPQIPERDFLSEAILNLGPALGAMFLGEAGAKAAPTTFTQARSVFEATRKDQVDRVKLMREDTEKKLKAAIDLKKSGQEAFDKNQQRLLEKAKTEIAATKDLAQMSATQLDKAEQRLGVLDQEISRQIGTGATDVAKMEQSKWLNEQKNKRTPRLQKPPELRLDKKKMVEKYASEVARMTGINSQVEQYKLQISDKSLSEADRLATANEQLKLINSTIGSDAVGAEETKRLAAMLDPWPNYIKRKPGADLDGFIRQLDRINQRISGSIRTQQNEIDKIYGDGGGSASSQAKAGPMQKTELPPIVEKVIKGVKKKYKLNPATGKYSEVK